MRDISARELKGHNILAVERFRDNTRWMIEFSVLRSCTYGSPGDETRLFLTEDGYQAALLSHQRREIKDVYKRQDRLCLSPQCGFASTEEGNKLTEEDQWKKLALIREIAEEVWG